MEKDKNDLSLFSQNKTDTVQVSNELNIFDESKADGYVDINKKIGQKVVGASGFNLTLVDDATIAALYVGNGLAKRYIDLLVDDMTRQWISIPEDTDGKMLNYLKNLGAKKQFKDALRCSKLFGGSIIFMVIEDGNQPNEPVDIKNIKSIKKLRHFSRKFVTIDFTNYYSDPTSEKFGDPEYFTINSNGQLFTVHESRCLVFKGEYYPVDELGMQPAYERYWGLSTLQSIYEILEDYGIALQALFRTLTKFNIDVLKIKNLMALLASPNGQKQLDARVQMFDLAKSVSTTLLLDNDETFETVSQALTGVAEVFHKIESSLSGVTGVPSTILHGTSAKGLQADGSGEMRIYYDKIKSDQEEEVLPALEYLEELISYAKDSGLSFDAEYNTKFNSLWQETESELVNMRAKQSETDERYVNMGAVDPNEIRKSRFGGDNYSIETEVEGDAPEAPEPVIEIPTKPANKENKTKVE